MRMFIFSAALLTSQVGGAKMGRGVEELQIRKREVGTVVQS